MKVLLSWLREFAPIEGDPAELADQMSDLGMAVESMTAIGGDLGSVVVARVLALRPHPSADRIQLVDVDAGDGEALQICCGAFNMAEGDLVPLATLGTTMPGGLEIARRKLRGEWSNGMLCSAAELRLGGDEAGIMVLDTTAPPGTPLSEALGLAPDVLYDLEINPNRPDAMSVAGVARDLAARLGAPFALPDVQVDEEPGDGPGPVEILAPDLCGRFVSRVLRGVTVGASPPHVANRLRALGMRPINAVVDASNYVMLELGQPNHTFDLAKVPGGQLRVRWAHPGERIVTLDGVERELGPGDGVVADRDDRAISIAGVMGGASTEIDEGTIDVLLEMAWWQPMAIARSAKRLGLRSEASARFERGTDPEVIDHAARRFAALLAEAGARLEVGTVDARGGLPAPAVVQLRTARVNGLLGTDLDADTIRGLLEPIGFACASAADGWEVRVPSFRPDTATETDVIEEVARHHGYGRIPRTVPANLGRGALTPRQVDRRAVRQALVGLGIDEAMPMPFLEPGQAARTGSPTDEVHITNPLAAEESVLRTSLRAGLLAAVGRNEAHRLTGVHLFEVGKVFRARAGAVLPDEPEELAVALAGAEAPEAVGVWRVLATCLGVDDAGLRQEPVPGLHPGRSAVLLAGGQDVGVVGEIDPDVAAAFGCTQRVAWLEVDLDRLSPATHHVRPYRPVSRFPSSDIDLAFEAPEEVPAAAVEGAVRGSAGELLVDLDLFDVFRGAPLPDGTRSLAFRLRLQAPDRTLTDDEVADVRRRVVEAVEAALPVRLRG